MTRASILEISKFLETKKLTFHARKFFRSIDIERGGVNGFTVSNISDSQKKSLIWVNDKGVGNARFRV